MVRGRVRAALIVPLMIFFGCSRSVEIGPPEVHAGIHECDTCRMIISDLRFAATARLADGSERRFDDLGCLLASPSRQAPEIWFRTDSGWMTAESVSIQAGESSSTPMGSGWRAIARPANSTPVGIQWEDLLLTSDGRDDVTQRQAEHQTEDHEVGPDQN